jgi:hypothetical protein
MVEWFEVGMWTSDFVIRFVSFAWVVVVLVDFFGTPSFWLAILIFV